VCVLGCVSGGVLVFACDLARVLGGGGVGGGGDIKTLQVVRRRAAQ
jgi:hypothetical protein